MTRHLEVGNGPQSQTGDLMVIHGIGTLADEGDRIIITMTPELGYGARERPGIPANSTLVFDYEILAVKPLSFASRAANAANRKEAGPHAAINPLPSRVTRPR